MSSSVEEIKFPKLECPNGCGEMEFKETEHLTTSFDRAYYRLRCECKTCKCIRSEQIKIEVKCE